MQLLFTMQPLQQLDIALLINPSVDQWIIHKKLGILLLCVLRTAVSLIISNPHFYHNSRNLKIQFMNRICWKQDKKVLKFNTFIRPCSQNTFIRTNLSPHEGISARDRSSGCTDEGAGLIRYVVGEQFIHTRLLQFSQSVWLLKYNV